jgi:hypothetical protein
MLEDVEWEDPAAASNQVIDLEPSDIEILAQAYANRSLALGELGRVQARPGVRSYGSRQ